MTVRMERGNGNMEDNQLEAQVLESIVKKLGIEGSDNGQISYDVPLFSAHDEEGVGLQLDSIDSLEVIIAINQSFGVKISSDEMSVLRSVSTIADHIRKVKNN